MSVARDELSCQEFVELVTDYLEDALPAELRDRVEAHLQVCDGCTLYLGQIRVTVRALKLSAATTIDRQFRERMLHNFRNPPHG